MLCRDLDGKEIQKRGYTCTYIADLRTDSLEKSLTLGKLRAGEGGYRGSDGWMASLTQWT